MSWVDLTSYSTIVLLNFSGKGKHALKLPHLSLLSFPASLRGITEWVPASAGHRTEQAVKFIKEADVKLNWFLKWTDVVQNISGCHMER